MAAQADVVFRMAADVGSAIAALQEVEKQLAEVADKGKKAGESLADVLGSDLSDAFGMLNDKSKALTGGMASLSGVLGGLGVAVAGAAGLAAGLGVALHAGIEAAVEAEDAQNRLRVALAGQGAETVNNVNQLNALASALSESTRFSSGAITEMQAMALQMGVNAGGLDRFTQAAVDTAAALRIDLNDAGRLIAQTMDGTAGKLANLVPELRGLTEEQLRAGDAVKVLSERFRGMAEADAQTVGGALAQLKNTLADAVEQFGLGFTGASDMAGALREVKDWVVSSQQAIRDIGEAIGYLARNAFDAARELSFLFADDTNALADTAAGKYIEANNALREMSAELQRVVKVREDYIASGSDRSVMEASRQTAEYDRQILELQKQIAAQAQKVAASRGGMVPGADGTLGGGPGGLDAGNVAGGGKTSKDAVTDAQKLAEEFAKLVNLNESLRNIGADVYATDSDRLDVVRGQLAATETLGEKIKMAILEGTLTREEADAMLAPLAQSASDFFLQARQDAIANGAAGLEDIRDATISDGGPNMFAGYDTTNADAAAALDEQRFQMVLERIQQGYDLATAEQMVNDVLVEQGQIEEDLAQKRERAIRVAQEKAQKDGEWMKAMQGGMGMVTSAAGNLGSGLMKMALTGEGSFKAMAQAVLQSLAIESAGKAVFEVAEGFAALALQAMGHPTAGASAAMHFKSAAMFGVMAAGFGAMSAAAGQPDAGGGGGAGASRGGGGEDELTSFGSTRRGVTQPAEAGPRVAVYFTGGVVAGTSPEEFSRMIQPYIEQTVQEAGNRSSSRRG